MLAPRSARVLFGTDPSRDIHTITDAHPASFGSHPDDIPVPSEHEPRLRVATVDERESLHERLRALPFAELSQGHNPRLCASGLRRLLGNCDEVGDRKYSTGSDSPQTLLPRRG